MVSFLVVFAQMLNFLSQSKQFVFDAKAYAGVEGQFFVDEGLITLRSRHWLLHKFSQRVKSSDVTKNLFACSTDCLPGCSHGEDKAIMSV